MAMKGLCLARECSYLQSWICGILADLCLHWQNNQCGLQESGSQNLKGGEMPLHSQAWLFCRLYPTCWWQVPIIGQALVASPNAGDIKARFSASTCAGLMHGAENAPGPAIKMSGNCVLTTTSVTLVPDSMERRTKLTTALMWDYEG